MDGFKNSSRTHYMKGGSCEGYAKGGKVKGAAKINKVMGEFKRGELHSGSKKGPEVTNPKQAVAIALSEARQAGAKIPVKKARGGSMGDNITSRPVKVGMTDAEKATAAALARAERMQALEAAEEQKLMRTKNARPMPKPSRPLGRGAAGDIPVPRDPRTPLINRKHGGLAVMPGKKK